ncbi:hypothetical protein [Calidifontibacillus erzurumensis]|uniref:Uncharacterized protein n=1 Tax=Calidifontibacillus erzurumensis TaxID=2741433 RepID=A0A8J8GDF3_9BACI|nr:hypothetical protein [Calidifontibacillus erzurumensis]NSL51342.1 hypothetical protein [Calidifontibacillus erzurumensis]
MNYNYYYDYERQFGFPSFPGGGGFPGGFGQLERRLNQIENQLQRHTERLNRLNRRLQRVERQLGFPLEQW